jgi:hypothetical protein
MLRLKFKIKNMNDNLNTPIMSDYQNNIVPGMPIPMPTPIQGMPGYQHLTRQEVEKMITADRQAHPHLTRGEVDGIITTKIHANSMQLDNQIKNTVNQTATQWTNNNLPSRIELTTNCYLKQNLPQMLRQEIINGNHLKEVEQHINTTARNVEYNINQNVDHSIKKIEQIVKMALSDTEQRANTISNDVVIKIASTKSEFDPIFQAFLKILSDRNAKQLDIQQADVVRAYNELVTTKKDLENKNLELVEKTKSLRRSLSFTQVAFFLIMVGILVSFYLVCTDAI